MSILMVDLGENGDRVSRFRPRGPPTLHAVGRIRAVMDTVREEWGEEG